MTDTEKAALERRIDELCQENEQLRQELAIRESSEQEKVIDYLGEECVDWEDKYLALAGENAKLRVELTDLRLGSCPSCGIKVENECLRELCMKALGWLRWAGGITCPPEVPDEFADELRELGIEVPS